MDILGLYNYQGSDSKNYLAFSTIKFTDFGFHHNESTVYKFSLDSNKVVYHRKLDTLRYGEAHLLSASQNKFWLSGNPAVALNESNGDVLVRIPSPTNNYSGYIYEYNNKVILTTDGTVYGFDANSGSQVWKADGKDADLASRLVFGKGVIYYTNEKLHAVDAETGATIWNDISPDYNRSIQNFTDGISIDSTTNRIYTATYYSAICYKAAR